jgi:hypothetical protein
VIAMSWMVDHADELKAAAQERRNRGISTGKQAKGWTPVKRPDAAIDSFERLRIQAKACLRDHFSRVLADYQAEAFPDREIPY